MGDVPERQQQLIYLLEEENKMAALAFLLGLILTNKRFIEVVWKHGVI